MPRESASRPGSTCSWSRSIDGTSAGDDPPLERTLNPVAHQFADDASAFAALRLLIDSERFVGDRLQNSRVHVKALIAARVPIGGKRLHHQVCDAPHCLTVERPEQERSPQS